MDRWLQLDAYIVAVMYQTPQWIGQPVRPVRAQRSGTLWMWTTACLAPSTRSELASLPSNGLTTRSTVALCWPGWDWNVMVNTTMLYFLGGVSPAKNLGQPRALPSTQFNWLAHGPVTWVSTSSGQPKPSQVANPKMITKVIRSPASSSSNVLDRQSLDMIELHTLLDHGGKVVGNFDRCWLRLCVNAPKKKN